MFNIVKKEINWAGKKLSIETGKIARQANGAVILRSGDTVILATAVAAKKSNPETDFFPLTVNYQEKYYAAGKIPGGYFKREARPTEAETLISRLIDRPIRPLFPSSFLNEVQLLPTVLSYDGENQPDVLSIIASSAALAISGLPFQGPIAASRVGYKDGKYLLNPSLEELKESELDLVVAGTKDAVLMVESETSGLSEKIMLDAVDFGHKQMQIAIEAIIELAEAAAKEIETTIQSIGHQPIHWLMQARKNLQLLKYHETPNDQYTNSIYVILRDGYTEQNGRYGLYVGETSKTVGERFAQHLSGIDAGRGLQDHGMQLMYSLMWPWQKVPGAKRLYYEAALHKALELKNENGPKVSGNAEVIDNWPKRFQSKLLRELAEN